MILRTASLVGCLLIAVTPLAAQEQQRWYERLRFEGDFRVLDGLACDRDGAKFQLPANPFSCPVDDPECLGSDPDFQNYTVWARALGKPGGSQAK